MLHGWHQNHKCWLRTASVLRDKLGMEVLLLDFYNHGESPTLPQRHLHCAEVLCRQLRALVLHLGWQEDRLSLGGVSLGGAVALHYFSRWPKRVAKLILIGAAGLDEPIWVPSKPLAGLWHAVLGEPPADGRGLDEPLRATEETSLVGEDSEQPESRQGLQVEAASASFRDFPSLADAPSTSLPSWMLARLSFPTTAPSYRVPADIIPRLIEAKVGVAVVTAGLDILHRPQRHMWKTIPGVWQKHFPWMDHTVLCLSIFQLRLWEKPELWLESPAARL